MPSAEPASSIPQLQQGNSQMSNPVENNETVADSKALVTTPAARQSRACSLDSRLPPQFKSPE